MLKVRNMIELTTEVERFVKDFDMSYIEAVMEYISINNMEVEDFHKLKSLLSPLILQRLEEEAYKKNLMGKSKKRPAKLPI